MTAMHASQAQTEQRQRFWRFLKGVIAMQTARRGRTYTQQDLANDLGISPGTVSKYAKLQIDPLSISASVISGLADLSGLSVASILSHVETGVALSAIEGPTNALTLAGLAEQPRELAAALRVVASALEACAAQAVAEPAVVVTEPAGPPAWYTDLVDEWFAALPPAMARRFLEVAAVDAEEFRSGEAMEVAPESVAQLLGLNPEELLRRWQSK